MKKERARRTTKYDPTTPAAITIDKFGGITRMHEGTGIAITTLYGWAKRGRVPSDQFPAVLEHAKRLKIKLKAEDLFTHAPKVEEEDASDS